MIKNLLNIFNKSQDKGLISRIKSLPLNENFINDFKEYLKKESFENIDICDGENINIKRDSSENCCMDIFFEKEYLYMLTIFEDGLLLLKNKNKVVRDSRGYAEEEIEYVSILKLERNNQILSSLRTLIPLETEFDFLDLYEKGFFIVPEFSIREQSNPKLRTTFNKIEDNFAKYGEDLKGNYQD